MMNDPVLVDKVDEENGDDDNANEEVSGIEGDNNDDDDDDTAEGDWDATDCAQKGVECICFVEL